MKKYCIFLLFAAMGFIAYAANNVNTPSKEIQSIINDQAEDWIDDMPFGLQERLSDALYHSMRGFANELQYFRKLSIDSTDYTDVISRNLELGENGVAARIYESKNNSKVLPLFVFFHGGGLTVGSTDTTDKFCKLLASSGMIRVISIEYPLMPENNYHSIFSKSSDAINYILQNAKSFSASPENIILGGEGAGGNLAMNISLNLDDKERKHIKSLVLYYPIFNYKIDSDGESAKKYGKGYGLDRRVLDAFTDMIAFTNSDINELEFNKKEAEILRNLPPTLMIIPGRDILFDDTRSSADRINANGVTIQMIEYSGALHGFISDNHQIAAMKNAAEATINFIDN